MEERLVLTDADVPQARQKMYYIAHASGSTKKDPNKQWNRIDLVQIGSNGKASVKQFFCEKIPEVCEKLSCFDPVVAVFDISEIDRPRLIDLVKAENSKVKQSA